MRKSHYLSAVAAAAAVALTLAGCSAESTESTSAGANVDAADCVATATDAVATASAEQPLLAPADVLDTAALEGKNIWFITLLVNQYVSDLYDGFEEAAEAAGMEPTMYDGLSNIARVTEGISQAVAQDADGIVLVAVDPSTVPASLEETTAAGIPVLNFMTDDVTGPVHEGTFGNLTANMKADGAAQAMWALADSGCQADVVLMEASVLANFAAVVDGAEEAIADTCADCSTTRLDIDLANVATDVPAQLQSALQSNPDTNYILSAWDSSVPFVAPVLATTASEAKVGGHDGLAATLEMIKSDSGQDMTMAMTPTGHQGWLAVDEVARVMLGGETPDYVIPTRLIDATNVGDGSESATWPAYDDYQQAFEDAWAGN